MIPRSWRGSWYILLPDGETLRVKWWHESFYKSMQREAYLYRCEYRGSSYPGIHKLNNSTAACVINYIMSRDIRNRSILHKDFTYVASFSYVPFVILPYASLKSRYWRKHLLVILFTRLIHIIRINTCLNDMFKLRSSFPRIDILLSINPTSLSFAGRNRLNQQCRIRPRRIVVSLRKNVVLKIFLTKPC